jgi:1,4-alpha-glucan branching enzyme
MIVQPGKKLLFMGGEFGQWNEWNHNASLDWHLLDHPRHEALARWAADVNHFYKNEPALHETDCDPSGFEFVDANDADNSMLSFLRRTRDGRTWLLVVCNFTPVPRHDYHVGVPADGWWEEALNSDASHYGGSGLGNLGGKHAEWWGSHGRPHTLRVTAPPLSIVVFRRRLG